MAIRTIRSHPLAIAGAAFLALAACGKPNVSQDAAPADGARASALSSVLSEDWESGIPASWTAATTSGLCTWHVVNNPQTISVSSALNPFSVTLPDSGAHLPAKGGTHVVWFGEDSTGTFIGSNYPAQSAKNGGSSAAVQAGTLTSPSISLAGAAKAAIEFDSWWEIEGVAGQSYDMMIVQVSTNGSTWTEVGRLNPTFSTGAPSDSGYTAGGSSAPPEWRHYAFDVSSYAGQSIQVRFSFSSGDTAYNAFRGWTIDNLSVGAGDSLPAPTVTAVDPAIGTTNDVIAIAGTGFVQKATIWLGATQIATGNIMQLGTDYALVKVPSGLTNGTKYDVKVVNPDTQQGTLVQGFTYSSTASPTVSSVAPATGSVGVAQSVAITGTNFVAGASVAVGPYDATGVTVNGATSITATFPAMPSGNYNVIVTNPGGQAGTKYAAYTIPVVVDSSTVTVTSPNGGESWGAGTSHAITWTQTGVTTARIDLYKGGSFDQAIATGLGAASGSYTWTIPAGIAAGTDYTVKVSNQLGINSDYSNASFTIFSAPAVVCGNGALEGGETCDDGNVAAGDGCSATCLIESGWSCPGGTSCAPVCGDGAVAGAEGCDDGGTAAGDGCSATCQVESGWSCPGGTSCAPVCGDGAVVGAEGCDDGNAAAGDGCSATCQVEPGYSCTTPGGACIPQYGVTFQTDGTAGASLTGSSSQTVLLGGSTTQVTAVPPAGWNFAGWTGTGGFVATSDNPLVVSGVIEDLTVTAHFVTVGSITTSSGGTMSAVVGTAFSGQLCVTVRDTNGADLAGVPVSFGVPASGARASLTSPVTSNASGLACTSATAGTVTGSYSVSAAGGSVTVATSATLTNLAGAPASLALAGSSTADQATTVGHAFTYPLAVVVRDAYANPVPGASVGFSSHADSGSGFHAILSSASAVTSASGAAQVTATAGTIAGWESIDVAVGSVPVATAFRLQGDPDAPATLTLDPGASPQAGTVGGSAFANALGLTVTDQWGNAVPGAGVSFTAPASGATAGLSAPTATTDAAGHAQVTGATGSVSGAYTVAAAVGGLSVPISLANTVGAPGSIVVVSGNGQAASVDGAFAAPLVVVVLDAYANPVPGVLVGFQLSAGTATATLSSAGQATGSDGRASVSVTPGVVSGPLQVVAAADGVASPVTFGLLLSPGLPASVTASQTSATQTAQVATAFQNALTVTVRDSHGNVVPGVQVTFTAPGSGASAALSTASATTGEDGVASVAATANTVSGDYQVSAAVEGVDLPALFALGNQPDAPHVLATSAGTAQSAVVHAAFATALEVTVNDQYGNPVPGVTVSFTAPDAGATAELAAPSLATGVSGKVSTAATAGTVSGAYLVTASASGVAAPVQFSLVNLPGAPEALLVKSGASGQSTRVGDAYAAPLAASVLDHYGNPVPGVGVTFACPASEPTCTLDADASTSNAAGEVAVRATAGTRPGTYQVTAVTDGVPPAAFQLTSLVGLPGSIESTEGASQEAGVLTAFAAPLGVRVRDAFGNVVPGVEVGFEVVSTGPQGAVLSSASATTDGDGLASVTATANAAKGSYSVEASAPGVAVAAGFGLANVSIATVLTPHIDLPVFGTVVQESAITHVRVAVGPDAGESKATGTVSFRASRPIRLVAGQAGVSQAGDALVATLVDGEVDLQIEVVGWRSRTLEIRYAPDEAAAQTWDPASTTVSLTAEVHDQTNGGGGGCSTGADGTAPLAVLPFLLLVLKLRRRRR